MTATDLIDAEGTSCGQPRRKVVNCYSTANSFYPASGVFDLTEGIYHGDPTLPPEQAQANQHNYLLDQIGCEPGRRILDIGFGYGTLLERARERGATGVGISISPEQVAYGESRGLDVHLCDYREAPASWNDSFDGIIANGSMEHFAGANDAIAGRTDDVYREMFATVHRLIDPRSDAGRFATTTIHFVRTPRDPRNLLRSPLRFRWGSDDFHWAMLAHGCGGYYPEMGQLQRCAEGYFDLVEEVDGTEDYLITSKWWSDQLRKNLRTPAGIWNAVKSLAALVRYPKEYLVLVFSVMGSSSWSWQFTPPDPPTRLLRQVWAYRER